MEVLPFDPERPASGAQVITADVVAALAPVADVTVLHGCDLPEQAGTERVLGPSGVRALAAFPLDGSVWRSGHMTPRLVPEARRALAAADLVIMVERVLDLPSDGTPRVVCLGGVGFPHSFDVIDSGAWDRLVVPSPTTRRAILRRSPDLRGVMVIENGVDPEMFAPGQPAPRRPSGARPRARLLFPSRPVASKGVLPALDLAAELLRSEVEVTVRWLAGPDALDSAQFARVINARAGAVPIEPAPWRSRRDMPAVYRAADLTICFSAAPEGFGLAAAESIACGTPVLAWPSGFLAEMFPPGHGLYLVDPGAGAEGWAAPALRALAEGAGECYCLGRPYLRSRYGADRMARGYRELVSDLLAE
ncbi:glycosyltransferase family 4 protein [Actinomadura sp. 9N215]|uniref:glycosyltransferase family 4 protein n=1 Tax=Actinomadura sp. 9N215 TaxID=3375150 RepID=UPI00378B475B